MHVYTPGQIYRYRRRVSGPLLDRIDIHIEVPAVPYKELSTDYVGEKSEDIRKRAVAARDIQLERFKGDKIYCNGQMKTRHIKKFCELREDARNLLETAMHKLGLSARAYARILKLSVQLLTWNRPKTYSLIIYRRRYSTGHWIGDSIKLKMTVKKMLDKNAGHDYSMLMKLSNYAKIFKALSNEQRLKIFIMLYKNCCVPEGAKIGAEFRIKGESCCGVEGGLEKAFTKICDCMNLSRSTISHHFKELQNAGLITCEREGQLYRCRVNKEVIDSIKSFLE